MVVIVDGLTASAAEIVAACLQDHGRAVVVGSRTFGKATVQTTVPLSDGRHAVRLTTAEYLRPNLAPLHRQSLDPDTQPWGVSPDRGYELTPTGGTLDAVREWRLRRDVVPRHSAVVSIGAEPVADGAGDAKSPHSKQAACTPFTPVSMSRSLATRRANRFCCHAAWAKISIGAITCARFGISP
jgi:hypothetical protein